MHSKGRHSWPRRTAGPRALEPAEKTGAVPPEGPALTGEGGKLPRSPAVGSEEQLDGGGGGRGDGCVCGGFQSRASSTHEEGRVVGRVQETVQFSSRFTIWSGSFQRSCSSLSAQSIRYCPLALSKYRTMAGYHLRSR